MIKGRGEGAASSFLQIDLAAGPGNALTGAANYGVASVPQ